MDATRPIALRDPLNAGGDTAPTLHRIDGETPRLLSRVQFPLVRRDVQSPHMCIRQKAVVVAALAGLISKI